MMKKAQGCLVLLFKSEWLYVYPVKQTHTRKLSTQEVHLRLS